MWKALAPLFLAICFPVSISAQSVSPEAIVDDFVKMWNSQDMKALDRLFTDDATWVPAAEVIDEGRGNIVKDFSEAHTTWAKTTTVVPTSATKVRTLRPDIAVVLFHLGFVEKQGNRIPDIDRAMLVVAVKQSDGWRIAVGQITKQSPQLPAQTFRDCAECPEMVVISAGSFTMGSPADEPGRYDQEGPQRQVSIRQFAAGKFDVTRGQWAAFISATNRETPRGCAWTGRSGIKPPWATDPDGSWRNLGFPQDDSHPAVCVTWNDAQDFVRWLSQRTGHKYRLLTESEWEYAARAGTTTPYPWGSSASHDYANYGADECCSGLASGRDQWVNTSPVGSFPPNAFGLYDMNGNVLQWVQDCFASSYSGLPTDSSAYETVVQLQMAGRFSAMTGTSSCSYRMLRGGDSGDPPKMIRSAYRNFGPGPGATLQDYRSGGVGFRVARTLD
jgi:uncharacterized protein (TIGR02246 family)